MEVQQQNTELGYEIKNKLFAISRAEKNQSGFITFVVPQTFHLNVSKKKTFSWFTEHETWLAMAAIKQTDLSLKILLHGDKKIMKYKINKKTQDFFNLLKASTHALNYHP